MNMYSQTVADVTLDSIERLAVAARAAAQELYAAIRRAKSNGYSFNELEAATGLPRGTVQNVVSGRTPRLTVDTEPDTA